MKRLIFHVDVNSAFLSWQAKYELEQLHSDRDLRLIPSAVGGDPTTRHGIVLAKSTPAKKYGVTTGEPLSRALEKCPQLVIVQPRFEEYVRNSRAFIRILREVAPIVEQASIDEAYCDMSGTERLYGDPVAFAQQLKKRIHDELRFTVNIGISNCKLLAKMASDFEKPDRVHTLFPNEIEQKMWPLPAGELFLVGRSSTKKLRSLGIHTIRDIACMDPAVLQQHFGKQGLSMWEHAHGMDPSPVQAVSDAAKSYGNSVTLRVDVTDAANAKIILLSLCETVGARLRADHAYIRSVSVTIKDCDFRTTSHQVVLPEPTNVTEIIYQQACLLFDQLWDQTPIRLLGVSTGKITDESYHQMDLFSAATNGPAPEKLSRLNAAIDQIRGRYGEDAVKRARFLENGSHMTRGLNKAKRETVTDDITDTAFPEENP